MKLRNVPDFSDSELQNLPEQVDVLIIEADIASRGELVTMVAADDSLNVVGAVAGVAAALELLARRRVHVVLLDQALPAPGSVDATRRIMQAHPLPIVLCSTTEGVGELVFRALEAGAVACVDKPQTGLESRREERARHLCATLRLMSEVKVVRRWSRAARAEARMSAPAPGPAAVAPAPRNSLPAPLAGATAVVPIVGIGASTGGPMVLQTILAALPQPFPAPILIVQHMSRGFMQGMVEWLAQSSGVRVELAGHGTVPLPGCVYVAPDQMQMAVNSQGQILLSREPDSGVHQPSVAWLFRSLAEHCAPGAIGVLLTGMGRDGAAELKLMKDRGSITIAQDRDTSTVHGMPGEAIALGGASYVLAADKIADMLTSLLRSRSVVSNP